VQATKTLINALSYAEVRLIDHVIVAGEQVVSMAKESDIFR
jgi:DNA repair protein RadC